MVDDNLEGQMATPLEQYQQQYEQLKAELVDIGFVCQGSVLERYTSCGNPNCRCQADPPQRHGPYWQWTRKVAAKTVTVRLSPEEAVLYQEWIDNNRRLRRIVADMDKVSTKARKILLAQAAKAASK
ncbi:MAG: hypothetical protein IPQ14_01875 [Candidatus Microthrix sp.]|uniref:DUF6788 family protein n=1 Tax=Candidatus Neomicrothrix sp. TaxID=2719034 RepID=UPI0025C16EE1|nr:DUF6788 family protein [Candidatus Microthrix sp.]MBL0203094.1 hypothetical protein [Candidatus Microthrix sp.]